MMHDEKTDAGASGTAGCAEVLIVAQDGRRMAVRVAPLGARTHLVVLDLDNHPWFVSPESLSPTEDEWLRAVVALGRDDPDYGWDTPRYRELCIRGGLDPDHGRPRFREADSRAAEELVRIVNLTRAAPGTGTTAFVHDLIGALRTDVVHADDEVDALRRGFARIAASDPTTAGEIMAIVENIVGRARAQAMIGNGKQGPAVAGRTTVTSRKHEPHGRP